MIPVAIFSSDTFDATTVDPETVALAGAQVKMADKSGKYLWHEEDVNEDGLLRHMAVWQFSVRTLSTLCRTTNTI